MQLPELFGSSYIFLAIVVGVVLLIGLLLLHVMQRRRKAAAVTLEDPEATAKRGADRRGADMRGADRRPSRSGRAARHAALTQAGEDVPGPAAGRRASYGASAADFTPQPDLADLAAAPTPPESRSVPPPRVYSVPIEEILPASDPLQAVISEILGGWGDLTQEDTNRLEVFRTDRVVAAVTTAEVPRQLKNSEYARARLTQLRRWAGNLERRGEAPRTPEREYGGIDGAQIAAAAPVVAAAAAAGTASSMAGTPAAAAVPAMPAIQATAAVPTVAAAPQLPPLPAMPAAPEPRTLPAMPSRAGGAGGAGGSTPPVTPQMRPPATGPAMANLPQPPAWPVAPEVAAEPQRAPEGAGTVPGVPGADQAANSWKTEMAEAGKGAEAAIAAAAAAFWARPEVAGGLQETAPAPAQPPVAQQAAVGQARALQVPPAPQLPPPPDPQVPPPLGPQSPPLGQQKSPAAREAVASDDFLADLRGKINTADALMALPADEQANMLVFLKPSELAKVLHATEDTGLKKAVIDTLESVGSPTALDIIYHCLDDPDPQIQMRALDAADRLLGAE